MTEPLYQVHARCPLLTQPEGIHQVSKPMLWAEANMKVMEWTMTVESPDWEFSIEEVTDPFPDLEATNEAAIKAAEAGDAAKADELLHGDTMGKLLDKAFEEEQ